MEISPRPRLIGLKNISQTLIPFQSQRKQFVFRPSPPPWALGSIQPTLKPEDDVPLCPSSPSLLKVYAEIGKSSGKSGSCILTTSSVGVENILNFILPSFVTERQATQSCIYEALSLPLTEQDNFPRVELIMGSASAFCFLHCCRSNYSRLQTRSCRPPRSRTCYPPNPLSKERYTYSSALASLRCAEFLCPILCFFNLF